MTEKHAMKLLEQGIPVNEVSKRTHIVVPILLSMWNQRWL